MDFNNSPSQIMADVRKRLTNAAGKLPQIAIAADIPYHTLVKVHQGVSKNPRLCTIVPLVQALQRHDETGRYEPVKKKRSAQPDQTANAGA